jgi:hypothetical protein
LLLANTHSASIAALNCSSRGAIGCGVFRGVLNYVTESAYDTVMWQKVQAKALFIEQMRRNEVLDTESKASLAATSAPRPPKPKPSPRSKTTRASSSKRLLA